MFNRDDFPMLNSGIIYFDNGATTFKPRSVIDITSDYYKHYTANAHRGDYKISAIVDDKYEGVRKKVKKFINAKRDEEIIFTSGATDSLNRIVFGFFNQYLNAGDEILITKAEHASNVLPWFELSKKKSTIINYIPLDFDLSVSLDNVIKSITPRTKVISLAHISNVAGDIRPIKEIVDYAHKMGVLVVVDGAQSVPHIKVDVEDLGCDFLAFSAHKMYGPTGLGVLYGKYELLDNMEPLLFGGGMNINFDMSGKVEYKELPFCLEAGTQNIAGVLGLGAAIDYLENIGMNKIHHMESKLKDYLLNRLTKLDNIEVYNPNTKSGIIIFNINDVFSQDTALFLDKHNICIRAGNHCAKGLKEELGIKNTCRISLSFYNSEEEIDKLINILDSNRNIYDSII